MFHTVTLHFLACWIVTLGYAQADDDEDDVFFVDEVDEEEEKPFKEQLAEAELMLRLRLKTLVRTEFWFWGVLFLVFVNTALRCTIHYGMPQWWEDTLYRAEVAFLVIFTLETMLKQGSQRAKKKQKCSNRPVLKLYGLSPLIFFRSKFNTFDLVVVLVSIVDFTLSQIIPGFSLGISVLRALRLLRIFKGRDETGLSSIQIMNINLKSKNFPYESNVLCQGSIKSSGIADELTQFDSGPYIPVILDTWCFRTTRHAVIWRKVCRWVWADSTTELWYFCSSIFDSFSNLDRRGLAFVDVSRKVVKMFVYSDFSI